MYTKEKIAKLDEKIRNTKLLLVRLNDQRARMMAEHYDFELRLRKLIEEEYK